MLVKEYKEKFQIARLTSLISEDVKEGRKNRTLKWWASLSADAKREFRIMRVKRYQDWAKKNRDKDRTFKIRLETKNKRGTCPDQLIEKIREVAKKLGHTPSKDEFIIECDSQRYVHLIYTTFGSWAKAVQKAGLDLKEQVQNGGRNGRGRYSDDELLDYLSLFHQENGRIPTEVDGKRGWIPNGDIYRRRFGSLPKERALAGIEENI